MSRTLESPELTARHAAQAADVEVVVLDELDEISAASELFSQVWGTGNGGAQLPKDLFRALTHAGNYAAGAFGGGGSQLVGAIAGFLGRDDEGTYLHSHILGVSTRHRGGNVGFALKQHQRAWAIDTGLAKVTWTFDPLVRRNAYFNLSKLGADAAAYYENFYGAMTDDVNAGDQSDRLLISWDVESPKAVAAASRSAPELEADVLIADGAAIALSAAQDGEPLSHDARGQMLLCATPDDIIALRRSDPERSLRWRHALRKTLGSAMHDGYAVTGFTRSGWYVLSKQGVRGSSSAKALRSPDTDGSRVGP